jgi:hypothetical protein
MDTEVTKTGEQASKAQPPRPFVERRANTEDRRRTTLQTFLRGAFIPRRRAGRRESDRDLPLDWHDPYLMLLSIAMLTLSVTDAFFTVTLMTDGARETNPLLAFMLDEHPRLFAAAKMTLTGVSVIFLVAVARSRLFKLIPVSLIFQALVLAYVALVGYEWWLVSLMP